MVVSRRYPPDQISGTETVISHVCQRAAEGFDVRLVAGWVRSPDLLPDGACKVDLARLPRPLAWARMAGAAALEARAFRPDVVLANSIETPTGLAPTVTIVYDFNFGRAAGRRRGDRLREAFYRRQSRGLARVVVISEATRQRAIERGFDGERIEVIHPGVDVDRFAPDDTFDDDLAGGARAVVAYPSRILPGKAQHLAIEAFRRLPGRWRERAELRIVGAVADPRYLAELRRSAEGLAVRFHTDVDDIARHYRGAHVVLFPTMMDEGFGYTLAEGMACGKPVVHFRCAAVDEAAGGHAVGVPAGDVDAMAAALAALLDDPARRTALGAAAREHVVARYSWDAIWARYRALLARVAGADLTDERT